jgi:hypothetical protein
MLVMTFEEYKKKRIKFYEEKFKQDELYIEVINELNSKLEECLKNNTPYLCFDYKMNESKYRNLFLDLSEYLSLLGYNVTRITDFENYHKQLRLEFDIAKSKYLNRR